MDRERELAALEQFWRSERGRVHPSHRTAPGRQNFLVEHFAQGKRAVYYRCWLTQTAEQLPAFGRALADLAGDPVWDVQPPTTWPALVEQLAHLSQRSRLLLVLDEIPYWVARDESLPSLLQNWWDERGRTLDLMLVLCGSAVQMMENLLTGSPRWPAVSPGVCLSGLSISAPPAELLGFADPLTI